MAGKQHLWERDPEEAYAKALQRVEQTLVKGEDSLDFLHLPALERLPPALSNLKGLKKLTLSRTQIADISPLSSLTGLEWLDLNGTQVTDISPLSGLTKLEWLDLNGTQVTDISPLSELTQLHSLDLDGTQVTDISPLAGLTQLQKLNLNGTQVTDISSLAGLTQLQSLGLHGMQVTDISPLAGLTQLQSLGLHGMQVTDISPLAGLTQLQDLNLYGTQVTDISPLVGLTQLRSLYLGETQVTDISSLAGLSQLQKLNLDGTQVTDISPLAGLTQLHSLNLDGMQVTDISPLAGLTQLHSLDLEGTQVTDISPLAGLSKLQWLNLRGTQVTDISPLAGLTQLERLDLRETQVADLHPLRGLAELAGNYPFSNLDFDECLATQQDPKLAQIAAIEDNDERVEALFTYLDTLPPWPEPLEKDEEKIPTQNPRFYAKVRDNVDIYPEKPAKEEVGDPIKQALHKKLRASIDVLERYGNRIDYIGDFARSMRRFLGETLAQTEMLMLHMEVETAKFHLEGEIEESDIVVALKEITRFGPALTLDNPGVMELDERTKRAEGESQSDNFTDIEVFARIMQENPKIFGEMLRIISGNIRQISESDQPQIPSDIRITYDVGNNSIRNTLIAIGAFMFATPTEGTIATELARFMIDNTQVFKNAAAAYGGSFKEWYDTVFVSVQTYFDKQ